MLETPLEDLGLNSYLEFWVKRDSNSGTDEQILFESENGAIKAVQKDTGKLGFTREGRDYSFNYELPKDEWVKIKLETKFTRTLLYVNDEFVDELSISATGGKWATLIIPLERIGSKTNAFIGEIDDVQVSKEEILQKLMLLLNNHKIKQVTQLMVTKIQCGILNGMVLMNYLKALL